MSSAVAGAWTWVWACASAVNDRQRPRARKSLARMPRWYWAAMRAASLRSGAGGVRAAQGQALTRPEVAGDQRQPAQPARGFENVLAGLGRPQIIHLRRPDARHHLEG